MVLVAQLSDPHVVAPGERWQGRVDTTGMLRAALVSVLACRPRPEALLLTGDLVASGQPQEYEALASVLEVWPGPLYLLPGNHDDRAALRAAFPQHAWLGAEGPVQYAVMLADRRLLVLDTQVPGEEFGALDAPQLDWLAGQLEAHAGERLWIAMHHPPFRLEVPGLDALGLHRGAHELERMLRAHGGVEQIICGYVHRSVDRLFGGALASCAPSTAYQHQLDWQGERPLAFNLEPAGYRLYALASGGGVAAHTVFAAQYAGPYAYEGVSSEG